MLEERALDLSDRELDATSMLLRQTFVDAIHLDEGYLRWSYCDNPAGPAVGRNAWDGARLVSHYVTVPLRARLFGEPSRGVLSIHTATAPAFRGRGLFPRLAEGVYADATRAGFDFVVGVSNAASTPVFVEKLGFQLVGPLEVRMGLGPPAAPRPAANAAPSFERLWNREELAWRLACPARLYRRRRAGDADVVYAPSGRVGIWVALGTLAGEALESAGTLDPLERSNPLQAWIGLDPTRDWRRHPWWSIPWWARPSPLNLIYRDLRQPGRTLPPDGVRFAALDFDAY